MEKISAHISYAEGITTSTGIANDPQPHQLEIMKVTAEKVFEPLRKGLGGKPIRINSFFRSAAVNKAIGGAHKIIDGKYVPTSQHCHGMALDLDALHCTNADIFFYILDNLEFDQLIWEKGDRKNADWIHVSYSAERNRGSVLVFDGRRYTRYEDGMLDRPAKKVAPTEKAPVAKKKAGRPKKTDK